MFLIIFFKFSYFVSQTVKMISGNRFKFGINKNIDDTDIYILILHNKVNYWNPSKSHIHGWNYINVTEKY